MNLAIFALLCSLRKKNLPDGVLTLIYMAMYSSVRSFIAFTSVYKSVALGLNQAQLISILVFAVSVPLLAITTMK